MTIDVRPRMSSPMPRSIARSVSGSTLAVASSRIRISGSARQGAGKGDELALAGREVGAPLDHLGVEPVRTAGDHPVGPHPARRCQDLRVGERVVAERDVRAQRPREHEDVLADDDHPPAGASRGSNDRTSTPAIRIAPP